MKLADLPVRAVEKGQITFRNDKGRACTPKAAGLVVSEKAHARVTDPQTSHEAAQRVAEFDEGHYELILLALDLHGSMTIHEIAEVTRLDSVAVARRMPELEKRGKARVSMCDGKPLTRRTPSGRSARVWEIA